MNMGPRVMLVYADSSDDDDESYREVEAADIDIMNVTALE